MKILFRADAGPQIGTGHIMRCLALAQEFHINGYHAICVTTPENPLQARLQNEGIDVRTLTEAPGTEEDAKATVKHAKDIGASWIIVDGYHFSSDYNQTIKSSRLKLLTIDDDGRASTFPVDIILNQNIDASKELYKRATVSTTLLLGTHYALLRQEFASGDCKRDIPQTAQKILVTLGGADPKNMTAMVIESLRTIDNLDVTVIIGSANLHREDIEGACKKAKMKLIVDSSQMKELMTWADIAVAAGGTTGYELACMGLPAIIIVLAENQRVVAEGLARAGTSVNLGWYANVQLEIIATTIRSLAADHHKRTMMSQRGKALVDGHGAARVCRFITDNLVWLRKATSADSELIFSWANDPETRSVSFSTATIPWGDHQQWYRKKLEDPLHHFFIAHNSKNEPVGLVRFLCDGRRATISVNVAHTMRGKGYGVALITQGCKRLFAMTSTESVDAFVKPNNPASSAAFLKSGFSEIDPAEIQGQSALHYTLHRDSMAS